ncbi:MAG: hypothetical protein ABI591_23720 [Kofleriaceae bacterium]
MGCTNEVQRTSLEGSITCGSMTCGSGQICFSMESGSQCDVNPDAGIGQYQEFGWTCGELPTDCDGVTRDCFPDQLTQVSADGRYVDRLCI